MIKCTIQYFGILLILYSFALPTAGQTIKERSDKAYARLSMSQGEPAIQILHELISYRITDTLNRAGILAGRAISESKKLNNYSLLSKSLILMSSVYIYKDKLDSATFYINQAGTVFRKYSLSENLDLYFYNLAKIRSKQNQHNESTSLFYKALTFATKNGNATLSGRIYLGIAENKKQSDRKNEYLACLRSADSVFRIADDPVYIGPARIGMGIKYLDMGLTERANEQFILAVQILERTADSLFLGYTYINISGLYQPGLPEKAEEYYQKAVSIFRALNNDRAMAYALNQKGTEYLAANKLSSALQLLTEAAILKERAADWQGACFVYANISTLHLKMKKPEKALLALNKAETMCNKAGDKLSLASCLQSKGAYFSSQKEYSKALEYYHQSMKLAQEIPVQGLVLENLQAISEVHQSKGDAAEALRYYKMYTSGKDSVLSASNAINIADLQLRYETEKKDSQIRSLINWKLKSERSKYYIVGNIIAVILLLFITIVFFFRLKGNFYERLQFLLTIRGQTTLKREKVLELYNTVIPDKASKPLITKQLQSDLWQQMQKMMETEKIYLNNELTLAEFARRLNTNTTYLSKVINDTTNQNFSNYLNQYRINEACRLLADPQNRNYTIESIALSVGFKSKSAFNTAFKKIKALTPTEYQQMQNEAVELLA